jgi:hypothetical protein
LGIQPGGDAALESTVERCLVPAIRANNTHVDTGIISTKYLMPLLTRAGRTDLALSLALNTDFPSWGGMALQFGATAITEHWNPTENPSGDAMSSRNHPAFGSVGSWLYMALLGVRLGDAATAAFSVPGLPPGVPGGGAAAGTSVADGWGFARALVAPELVTSANLTGVVGGVRTRRGWVGAAWSASSSSASESFPSASAATAAAAAARRAAVTTTWTLSLNATFPPGVRGGVWTPPSSPWSPTSPSTTVSEVSGACGADDVGAVGTVGGGTGGGGGVGAGVVVWANGAFVPGACRGVFAGAACGRKGDRICLDVGSGDWMFVATAAALTTAAA